MVSNLEDASLDEETLERRQKSEEIVPARTTLDLSVRSSQAFDENGSATSRPRRRDDRAAYRKEEEANSSLLYPASANSIR